jgi:F0F1-type ATP synthase assembly protein I
MEGDKKIEQKGNIPWWQPSIMLFMQLSGWIAVPIIIAVYLGKWLDQKYNTKPWLFLVTVGVAFAISMIGVVLEAGKAIKQMEKLNKDTASAKATADKDNSNKDERK